MSDTTKSAATLRYRTNLFKVQFNLTVVLVLIGACFLYNDSFFNQIKWLRVLLAPAIAGSLLVFLFFLCMEGRHALADDYEKGQVFNSILMVVMVAALICLSCDLLLSKQLERTVALVSIYLGVCLFFLMRYMNLWTMAVITGVVEGMLLYFVFIYGTNLSFFNWL